MNTLTVFIDLTQRRLVLIEQPLFKYWLITTFDAENVIKELTQSLDPKYKTTTIPSFSNPIPAFAAVDSGYHPLSPGQVKTLFFPKIEKPMEFTL